MKTHHIEISPVSFLLIDQKQMTWFAVHKTRSIAVGDILILNAPYDKRLRKPVPTLVVAVAGVVGLQDEQGWVLKDEFEAASFGSVIRSFMPEIE